MKHCWAIGTLLLASVLMGNACRHTCVSRNLCLYEEPSFDYRHGLCGNNKICCAVLRKPVGEISIKPNGPEDKKVGVNGINVQPSPTRGPTRDRNEFDLLDWNSIQNGGNPTTIVGQPTNNGGNPTSNGGNPTNNGGNPTSFWGRPTNNLGNPTTNGGNPTSNGGNPTRNEGNPTNNGGNPTSFGGRPTNNLGYPTNNGRHPTNNVGSLDPFSPGCGMSNANGLQMIEGITTDQARPAQYPWVVALVHNGMYLGSGSLIQPNVVLTAAHRLSSVESGLAVRAGDWDLASDQETFSSELREVTRVVIHDGFNFTLGANNLALLFLNSPFKLSDHIRTICLPTQNKSFEGRRCTVAGWGKMRFEDQRYSAVLKKVELPVVSRTVCENLLRSTRMGVDYQLPENIICAGGEMGRDACTGDGGSALFCSIGGENSGVYEQAGIVSWGIGCGQQSIPATYTEVSKFTNWIAEKVLPFDYRRRPVIEY
ncbi:phenoloxidase-activating factor 2 isoform X2 [Drosophila simulans]|uniref:phenoloxidase-activating factor 2 isoform X2 n=1 Tax=Drosophila simulans TaxID=7240 RepID=UPI001D0F4F1D|nr:phenoloxidase-activating factor 2 isoform X2 [Drosophila simulans]